MKVLIIKISSMGDLIHTLPALSDAKAAIPTIQFDWLADPAFAEIPTWHPAVNRVIPTPIRYWKRNKWQTWRQGLFKQFKEALQKNNYDLIIDAQSALKTAILATFARGKRAGFDKNSVREFGAQWFYTQSHFVDKEQHAILRLRKLFSEALHYPLPHSKPNFSIDPNHNFSGTEKYIVLVHGTTWKTKHWQTAHWQELVDIITHHGYAVFLPWGSSLEKERAEEITKNKKNAHVLPKLSLTECKTILTKASGAVCVDTGLGHLAAALNIPAIHLYGPTDPKKIGALGENQIHLSSDFSCAPCYQKNCTLSGNHAGEALCLFALSPQKVWELLSSVLDKNL